ncbi:MAG: glycosyltransferase family 2 protein [Pseudomonadota bacterium]
MTDPEPTEKTAPGAPDLVITMINYRTPAMTIDCAKSVLAHGGDVDFRLVLIDNNSGDGSADEIAAWIETLPAGHPVILVRSEENTGFAGGHNLGIGAVPGAAFYMPLNSDATIRPEALAIMLGAMKREPDIGCLGPALLNSDGDVEISAFRHHSPLSELIRAAATGPVTRLLQKHVVALPLPPDPARVEWVSFACVMIRREVLETIGLLDDGYFMYFEDADYCWKVKRAGWRIVYRPDAEIVHFRGGSSPVKTLAKARRRLPKYFYASRARLLHRFYGRLGLLAANLLWHAGRLIARSRALVGKESPQAVEHEALDIWTNFLDPTGDRHAPRDG